MLKPVVKPSARRPRLCGSNGFALAGFALLACAPAALAQQYSISTVAGGAPPATPVTATGVSIGQPRRVAVDATGNVYFSSGHSVFKVAGSTLSLIAGNSRAGFSGDGGPAVNAQLNVPQGIAVDAAGNVYIADSLNNRVRIVNSKGIINTFAGNGQTGTPGFTGDGLAATSAQLQLPGGVFVDSNGVVYIADTGDNTVRKVTKDGVINTIAGDGLPGFKGNGALATSSELHSPQDVAVDKNGKIYIADTGSAAIRVITTDGNIATFAGNGSIGFSGDGKAATSAGLIEPYAVAVDGSGNVYLAEPEDGRIRKVDSSGNIGTIAGTGTLGFAGDGAAASSALLQLPTGLAADSSGNLYIADSQNNRIRKVTGTTISTIAGSGAVSYSGDKASATLAQLNSPQAVAVDASGNVYIADTANHAVRQINTQGVISTIAGTGTAGSSGDNGAASAALLNGPQGIAVDASGNVYVSDSGNARVRKISNGTISTFAGNGTAGFGGDGAAATGAQLNTPEGLAFDKAGNLYIADFGNNVIRRVTPGGAISTVAGSSQGYAGNGGPALAAQLSGPQGVAVDGSGNIYIADTLNSVVRVVSPGGTITNAAGTGFAGYSGDGGTATNAQLGSPTALAVDAAGSVYVSDSGSRIRKILPGGIIVTIAGSNKRGYTGDGGPAVSATLNGAVGLAVDTKGNVFVADTANNAVRELSASAAGVSIAAVTNSATNQTGSIAPGEIVVIYGSNIGAASLTQYQLNSKGVVGTTLAGTTVFFNGVAGPVIYTSPNQVAAVVPFGISGTTAQVFVLNQRQTTAPVTVSVLPVAPGIFTLNGSGTGQAAAVNQDGSINGAARPVKTGAVISLYATGFGQTNPSGQDGLPAAVPLPIPLAPVSVTIGGKPAVIQYVGGAPGSVAGVMQLNAIIPSGLTAGSVPVTITVGNGTTQSGVTIVVTP